MRPSTLIVPLTLSLARLGTSQSSLNGAGLQGAGLQIVSGYFNLLAQKVAALGANPGSPPRCDLLLAQLPTAPIPLPPPSAGLVLHHVAVGRGTQNYTCDPTDSTVLPVSVGAVATLFNASCVAAAYPDLLALLPALGLQFAPTSDSAAPVLGPTGLSPTGLHYFSNATTPTFDLGLFGLDPTIKLNASAAPPNGPVGPDVPWLKLQVRPSATNTIREVYRVLTAGGSPPANCSSMPAAFQIPYAATYWFYAAT